MTFAPMTKARRDELRAKAQADADENNPSPRFYARTVLDLLTALDVADAPRADRVTLPRELTREHWIAAGNAVTALQDRGVGHHDKFVEAVWTALCSVEAGQ